MRNLAHRSIVVILFLTIGACSHSESAAPELTEALITEQALAAARELFGARFDPAESRFIQPSEIPGELRKHGIDSSRLPDGARSALDGEQLVVLIVPTFTPARDDLPMRITGTKKLLLMWEGGLRDREQRGVWGRWYDAANGSDSTEQCPGGVKCDECGPTSCTIERWFKVKECSCREQCPPCGNPDCAPCPWEEDFPRS